MPEPPPPPSVSAVLAALPEAERTLGPYRLLRKLGHGGFAPVWLAEEIYDGKKLRDVAIKLFFVPEPISSTGAPELAATWRDAVLEEARALCRVEHANVVRFYALQRDDARGVVGLVMEYVAGKSLDMLAIQAGRLAERVVVEAAMATAWALAAVHNAGLVHRDVKPANIVRGPFGYKLIDFGIAAGATRPLTSAISFLPYVDDGQSALDATVSAVESTAVGPGHPSFTPTARVSDPSASGGGPARVPLCGTLGYIAPECIELGEPASPASDLYALGVTIFKLMTGVLPGEITGSTAWALGAAGVPVPRIEPHVMQTSRATAELSDLTALLLCRAPNARPRHADWVARELDRIREKLPSITLSPGARASSPPPPSPLLVTIPRPVKPGLPAPGQTMPSVSQVAVAAPPNAPHALMNAPHAPSNELPNALPDAPPPLVGRDEAITAIRRAAREVEQDRARFLLFTGPLGVGRTRLLDAAAAEAGYGEARTLRLRCSPERRSPLHPLRRALEALPPFGAEAQKALTDALLRAIAPAAIPGADEAADAIEAIEDALLRAAQDEPLLVLVDDIQWSDAHTIDLLKLLVDRASVDGPGRLLVVATSRDEPSPSAALRSLLSSVSGKVRGRVGAGVKLVALRPLTPAETASLARGISAIGPEIEEAVVHGSGGVPFFVVHALLAWREAGAITWRDGALRAPSASLLRADVPGVADRLEARLASYFEPGSADERSALRALAAVALYGGGLGIDVILRVSGDEDSAESALETFTSAGILTASGDLYEYSFAQEMVRQAALNRLRPRPWFHRLHRALLDAVAERDAERADAEFLAMGYEKLGATAQARTWLGRAMEAAVRAGHFAEAAELGDRLAGLTQDAPERAAVELDVARALIRGRKFEDARVRLDRAAARPNGGGPGGALDLRRRIYRLEVARGRGEAGADDAELLADVDKTGDLTLSCEARMALAGVASEGRAAELIDEAVELSGRSGPAVEFAARVLRSELCYSRSKRDLVTAEADLRRALAIVHASASVWQEVHIEGDLATLEAERGQVSAAIDRFQRLTERAEALGMRGQLRIFSQNLAALLLREGRAAEAAETARRTAELAADAGDPVLRAISLSLRAEALRRAGDLDGALTSASEAEELQRKRGDRRRALTLLRRAEILSDLLRGDEAERDAAEARRVARSHEDTDLALRAGLWETLHVVRRGGGGGDELAQVVAEASGSGITLRAPTRALLDQAQRWLAAEGARQ